MKSRRFRRFDRMAWKRLRFGPRRERLADPRWQAHLFDTAPAASITPEPISGDSSAPTLEKGTVGFPFGDCALRRDVLDDVPTE